MDLGLKDRVYVVTGGTRGLGRAAAEALSADGAKIVLSGRDGRHAAEVAAELAAGGTPALGVAADNADPTAAQRLVQAAKERFGRFDGILISVGGPPPGTATQPPGSTANGAGDGSGASATHATHPMNTDEQWQSSFESVFLGAVRLARTAASELGDGGVIGFVLSGAVYEPIAGLTISNGLRPGLAGFAKSLADEVAPRGIRVVGLLPGRIDTDRVRDLDRLSGDAEASRAAAASRIPLGRYGTPEEFGSVAAYLLSPAASFLTGLMVPVDGGARRGF
jgi:3-oxoacyl-[acyl-carrier protein] reductase